MNKNLDLIIKNSRVIDPKNNIDEKLDIGIKHGKIYEIEKNIQTSRSPQIINQEDKILMPGHIDTHAHLSAVFNDNINTDYGHKMLAESGTTTALDLAGEPDIMLEGMKNNGAGLNVATIMGLVPHKTINKDDPDNITLRDTIFDVKKRGGIGVKILGGYFPFSVDANSRVIKEANEQLSWVAYHVGSKTAGSDLIGLREVPDSTDNGRLHVAHINSYTRGLVNKEEKEVDEALSIIKKMKNHWVTEAYMSKINGTNGLCDENGNLVYNVAQNCLILGGYEPNENGLRKALSEGYGSALTVKNNRNVLVHGDEAVKLWEKSLTNASLSFPVNPPSSAFRLSTEKYENSNDFVVDAISTDGGYIPRNVAIEKTMALVNFGALSLKDAVIKLSYSPSKMLGLENKGHLSEGADADITIIDPKINKACMSIVAGKVIMINGKSISDNGTWLVLEEGKSTAEKSGVNFQVINLEKSKLYKSF